MAEKWEQKIMHFTISSSKFHTIALLWTLITFAHYLKNPIGEARLLTVSGVTVNDRLAAGVSSSVAPEMKKSVEFC